MTVKELIEALSKIDPEAIVVMAGDGEGNIYSPLNQVDASYYQAVNGWSGTIADRSSGPRPGDRFAAVLWPVN